MEWPQANGQTHISNLAVRFGDRRFNLCDVEISWRVARFFEREYLLLVRIEAYNA